MAGREFVCGTGDMTVRAREGCKYGSTVDGEKSEVSCADGDEVSRQVQHLQSELSAVQEDIAEVRDMIRCDLCVQSILCLLAVACMYMIVLDTATAFRGVNMRIDDLTFQAITKSAAVGQLGVHADDLTLQGMTRIAAGGGGNGGHFLHAMGSGGNASVPFLELPGVLTFYSGGLSGRLHHTDATQTDNTRLVTDTVPISALVVKQYEALV